MFLATGQQLIAVIKPPFDFICSDGMERDWHGSVIKLGLSLVTAWEECSFYVCSLCHEGFYEAVRSHHSSFSYASSMKLKSFGDVNYPMDFLVTFLANYLWLEAKSILINVIHLVLFFLKVPETESVPVSYWFHIVPYFAAGNVGKRLNPVTNYILLSVKPYSATLILFFN